MPPRHIGQGLGLTTLGPQGPPCWAPLRIPSSLRKLLPGPAWLEDSNSLIPASAAGPTGVWISLSAGPFTGRHCPCGSFAMAFGHPVGPV